MDFLLTEVIKESIDGLLKKAKLELNHFAGNQILEYEVTEYKRNFYTKTVLHRTEPVPLSDFYMPLFINPIANRYKRIATTSAKELLAGNNITLFGDAGSGKSTLVKYLFVDCIRSHYKIPIKIELRFLNTYAGSLIDYIKLEVLKLQKLAVDDNIMERLLTSGDFVVFLDGYDEVHPSNKEKIAGNIDNLIKVFPENKYFLTSRPHTKIDLIAGFSNYEVSGFKSQEVDEFITKQTLNDPQLTAQIIAAIRHADTKHFQEFFSNPLLLSMFILTFRRYHDIPGKRSVFYGQVFNTLYAEHDELSKPGFIRVMRSKLNHEDCEKILQMFSFLSYFEGRFSFNLEYIYKKLNEIKERKKEYSFNNEEFVADLEISIGILNEDGFDYTFPHRSMQEYFSAKYISSLKHEDKNSIYKMLWDKVNRKPNRFLSDNKNFFIILSELDLISLMKNIVMPALEKLYHEIQKEGNSLFDGQVNAKIIDYNSEIEVLADNFILSNQDINDGKIRQLRETYSHYFRWEEDGTGFMPYGEASISIKYFMDNYKEWNDKINKLIHASDDMDIIALIPKS